MEDIGLKWLILYFSADNLIRRNIIRYFWHKIINPDSAIMRIFICPSYVCQLNCRHCYEEKKNGSIFLKTEEIKQIIEYFFNILHGFQIFFCSGEVLLRNDLTELISYASSKGIICNVVTNGILLSDEKIKELKKAGVSQFIVSIDSPDKDRHDELRGYKGCYDKALAAVRRSVKNGVKTAIWTYISGFNKNDLGRLGNMALQLGVSDVFVYFPLMSGKMTYKDNLTFREREKFRKKIKYPVRLEFPSEKTKCAGGGREHITILPTGDITPCPAVSYSYGNIRKDDLKEIFIKLKKDCAKFNNKFTGQCMINNPEYRETHVVKNTH